MKGKLFDMIFTQIKEVIKKWGSQQAEHEAIVSFDFKVLQKKEALMQLCFSPLANGVVLFFMILFYVNPFRYQLQLLSGATGLLSFLYTPQWTTGLIIGLVASYFFRLHWSLIVIVLYFVSQAEVNTLLASTIIMGIFFGEILRRLKLSMRMKTETKKIFLIYTGLQFLVLVLTVYLSLNLYQLMNNFGLFSRTIFAYRYEFISMSLIGYILLQLFINGIWGHFYSKLVEDSSVLKIYYSTGPLLNKMNLGSTLKKKILAIAQIKLDEIRGHLGDKDFQAQWPKSLLAATESEKYYLETTLEKSV